MIQLPTRSTPSPALLVPTVGLLMCLCSVATVQAQALVKDVRPGSAPSLPSELTEFNGALFFLADANGLELWKSDGTEAGTVLVKNIRPGNTSSSPHELTEFNGALFFLADANGLELWKSDGTAAGTVLLKDLRPGSPPSLPSELTEFNGVPFSPAFDDANGLDLWVLLRMGERCGCFPYKRAGGVCAFLIC